MEHAYSFLRSILYLRQTISVNADFERNDIIETIGAHFFKKVRWLSQKYFSTNYRGHNLKKLAYNDLYSTKKGLKLKTKNIPLFLSPLKYCLDR